MNKLDFYHIYENVRKKKHFATFKSGTFARFIPSLKKNEKC